MDGRYITEARTAAVSAVSVQHLAREDADVLAISSEPVSRRAAISRPSLTSATEGGPRLSRTAANADTFVRDINPTSTAAVRPTDSARDAVRAAASWR